MQNNTVVIDFKKHKCSKGIPNCVSVTKIGGVCCPHYNLANFLQCRGTKPGALFCLYNNKPLSYKMLVDWFAMLVNVCKFPKSVTLHCLCVGGATHCALLGKSDSQIQQTGRWSSRGCDAYLQMNSISIW